MASSSPSVLQNATIPRYVCGTSLPRSWNLLNSKEYGFCHMLLCPKVTVHFAMDSSLGGSSNNSKGLCPCIMIFWTVVRCLNIFKPSEVAIMRSLLEEFYQHPKTHLSVAWSSVLSKLTWPIFILSKTRIRSMLCARNSVGSNVCLLLLPPSCTHTKS